jgi:hypothetical protein
VSFAAIALSVASQQVFIVLVVHVIDSVRKILDTPSYVLKSTNDEVSCCFVKVGGNFTYHVPATSSLLGPNILLALCSQTYSILG